MPKHKYPVTHCYDIVYGVVSKTAGLLKRGDSTTVYLVETPQSVYLKKVELLW
jgi:hypothetical protein